MVETAYEKLRKCPECMKVLNVTVENHDGISAWSIHKATNMPYATIWKCMKELKKLNLVDPEEGISKKGGRVIIWKCTNRAQSAFDYVTEKMLENGEIRLETTLERIADNLNISAEDLLARMSKRLKKKKHTPPEYWPIDSQSTSQSIGDK